MEPPFDNNYDYLFTVCVLGDELVGKSSLIRRYVEGTFSSAPTHPTVGIDFKLKYLRLNDQKILLQLWDSSGKIKYRNLIQHIFAKVMGIILMLDVTNTKSLAQLGSWIDAIRTFGYPQTQIIVLGNKCDVNSSRAITREEMIQYTEQLSIVYMECSCKENLRIDQVFEVMINLIMNKMKEIVNFENL
eukprot:gene5116-236_t